MAVSATIRFERQSNQLRVLAQYNVNGRIIDDIFYATSKTEAHSEAKRRAKLAETAYSEDISQPEVVDMSDPAPPPPPPDPRAGKWAILKTYDPIDPATPKTVFNDSETIGVTVEIRDSASNGNLLPFNGTFPVPIFKDNGMRETVWVKRVQFTNGSASLTIPPGKLSTGYYGIDDATSKLVHAERQVITIQEP